MLTTITGVLALVLFICLILYVAVAAGLRPKNLNARKNTVAITALSLGVLLCLGIYVGASHLLSRGKADLYLAVQCLRQDEFEAAHNKLAAAQAGEGDTFEVNALNAMLYIKQGDYTSALQYIQNIEQNQSLSQAQNDLLQRVKVLAPAYVTDPKAGAEEYDSLCSALVQFLNLSVSVKTRCDKYYEIEHAVEVLEQTGMRDASIDISEMIGEFKTRYPDQTDIEYLKIRYHVVNHNYAYAVKSVEELLRRKDTLYHRALYADILLQDLYEGSGAYFPAESPDVLRYREKAAKLQEKISERKEKLNADLSDRKREKLQAQVDELSSQREEYLAKAAQVPAELILNYVGAKKGFLEDKTGIYGLLSAKAYYSIGDREKAEKQLRELVDRARYLSADSVVRIALNEAMALAAQCTVEPSEKTEMRFQNTVRLLVRTGGCISPVTGEEYLNAQFADYLALFLLQHAEESTFLS